MNDKKPILFDLMVLEPLNCKRLEKQENVFLSSIDVFDPSVALWLQPRVMEGLIQIEIHER